MGRGVAGDLGREKKDKGKKEKPCAVVGAEKRKGGKLGQSRGKK